MLRFVVKSDIWSATSEAARARLKPELYWHLKNIQDAVAIERLIELRDATIGEIGGGDSRLLPLLARKNRCFNIDRFDGDPAAGMGPRAVPNMPDVKAIIGFVGDPLDHPDDSFDLLFSVSVVEHVPVDKLDAFFTDCRRLLRPDGRMLHLIDVYLEDTPNHHLARRIEKYRAPFGSWLEAQGPVIAAADQKFSCAYATNPDHMMAWWNELVPRLAEKRAVAQSCTLIMDGWKRR